MASGERAPILPSARQRTTLLRPRTACILLVCAAACAFVGEVVVRHNLGRPQELVAVSKQEKAKEPISIAKKAERIIRKIPIVGEQIADWASEQKVRRQVVANAPKVRVDFYMEALCPGCQYFTTHVLTPVLKQKGISDLVELHIVPAGNAMLKLNEEGKTVMQCQHGEEECEGNKIISCMSHLYGGDNRYIHAFECIERGESSASPISSILGYNETTSEISRVAASCLSKQGLDHSPVFECAKGEQGQRLAELAINATADLTPKYEYAPWIVVDGVPIKEDAYSLKEYVCKAYQGVEPHECSPSLLKDYFPHHSQLHDTKRSATSRKQGVMQALSGAAVLFEKCDKTV